MMEKLRVILRGQSQRDHAKNLIDRAPTDHVVTVSPPARTLDQNAKIHAMCEDLARQVEWHGHWLTKDEWKDVLTAAYRRQKVVPGIDGGFVAIGAHTSAMTKDELSDLIEIAYMLGAREGVRWTDPQERKSA